MKVFLAGTYSRPYCLDLINDTEMKLFLVGEHTVKNGNLAQWDNVKILESYIYASKNAHFSRLILSKSLDFLLDSGAFTFMSDKKNTANWDEYIARY